MARKRKIFAPSEDQITAAEWRGIDGFPAYEVSNDGLVRNETGLLLKPEAGHRGHLRVTLYNEDGPQRHLVHRLVLHHFVGSAPSEKHECAHWDGYPANNQVGNLRWATRKENTEDTKRHGRFPVGEKSHFAKLTEVRAVEIRTRIASGASTRALAEEFGLDLTQINRIACGAAWGHLNAPVRPTRPRREVNENAAAEAMEAVNNGLSVSEAARQCGVSRQSINRRRGMSPPEKLIHSAVIEHWTKLGLPGTLVATLANANAHGQPGLTPGLPDLIIVGPSLPHRAPVGFIELKRDEHARVSAAQREFAELCQRLSVPFALTYGRDQPIRVLADWGVVRRAAA